jgi:hypothetical protein
MQSLKDVGNMTSELDHLTSELHSELMEGEINFAKMVQLADAISEEADRLAGAFSKMATALDGIDAADTNTDVNPSSNAAASTEGP